MIDLLIADRFQTHSNCSLIKIKAPLFTCYSARGWSLGSGSGLLFF
jgi:hypothetical protein